MAWYWSGFALHLFDPAAAIGAYRKAIELDPDFVTAHLNLAYLLRIRGRHEESLVPARRAVELDSRHPGGWKNVVAALRGLKRFEEIEEPLRKACELGPDDLENWYAIGMVRSEQGRTDEAIAALREAARLDPKHPFAANNLARLLVQKGDRQAAEKLFQRCACGRPRSRLHAAVNLGALLIESGRDREAVDAIVKGLRPGLSRRRTSSSSSGASPGPLPVPATGSAPRRACGACVELAPDDAEAWCDLGAALEHLHRYEEACAATVRATSSAPSARTGSTRARNGSNSARARRSRSGSCSRSRRVRSSTPPGRRRSSSQRWPSRGDSTSPPSGCSTAAVSGGSARVLVSPAGRPDPGRARRVYGSPQAKARRPASRGTRERNGVGSHSAG